jgi:hypothetical protein
MTGDRNEMRRTIVLALALLAATPVFATGPVWPVLVGGHDGLDACMTLGQVTRLDPKGDNFLAVREGPGTRYGKLDEIHTGDALHICDQKGKWFGVVYGEDGVDCQVSSPIAARNPYAGPCAAGWVHSDFIELIAG